MEFGTLVLSERFSLWTNYERVNGKYLHVTSLRVGKFMFQRPDNKKLIIEVEDTLLQDSPNKVYPLNEANAHYFKQLIIQETEEKKNLLMTELNEWKEKQAHWREKGQELQTTIDTVEERNKVEFSENRVKTIRELSKALRRSQNKIESTERMIQEKEKEFQKYELSKQYSLELVEKTIRKVLKG